MKLHETSWAEEGTLPIVSEMSDAVMALVSIDIFSASLCCIRTCFSRFKWELMQQI
jgi:hypothetical protein